MIDFLLLKSLHSTLGLSIVVCDKSFEVVAEYKSDKTISLYYNHTLILSNFDNTKNNFIFHNGSLGELFLAYHLDQYYIIIGPWRSNLIDSSIFNQKMSNFKISENERTFFFESLSHLPFFSLNQIRDLLILINYTLTGSVVDKLSDPLHLHTKNWSETLSIDKIRQLSQNSTSAYEYQYYYEDSILQAIKTGDELILKETVNQLSHAISPALSGDELRSEKNYSIMAYDRLSQSAIQSGLDIETAYRSRDTFVKDTEQAEKLTEILKLRDTAILFYTQQIGKINNSLVSPHSQTVIAIIQYLKNNLDSNIKTQEIAKQFHMSESKLRKLFKQEKNVTIQQYFLNLKIEATKQLLYEGKSLTEITDLLQFSTPANLSRTFKRLVGISPLKYRQKVNLPK